MGCRSARRARSAGEEAASIALHDTLRVEIPEADYPN